MRGGAQVEEPNAREQSVRWQTQDGADRGLIRCRALLVHP